ncbi:protein phosphatase 2C [Oesophagostomum dentatum]|uniref:Protein phosphatase 2C n=1 Tax=Oesophagostomum dentatum TaxID=61180 RepID=A0A0B1T775_OESDE|nr:protein phosphatase 2C [Oesophagostomum dentatum]
MNQGNYTDAAKITSTSNDLLNGRLSKIEGLSQLRTMIHDSSDRLSEKIIDQIVDILVVDPFESHMFDLVQSMPEQRVMESEQCSRLSEKAKRARSLEPVESRLKLVVSALSELGGGSLDIDRLMTLSKTQIDKQVAASVSLMRVRASIDENLAGDQTHLTQLIQMALVSDHLDITPLAAKEPIDSKKPLFRFDATAFASGTSTTDPTMQSPLVVCRPSAFNIVPMFPWLRKLMDSVEKETGESPCQLRSSVMTAAAGSCATLAHVRKRNLHVANVGDGAAVLGVVNPNGSVIARQLSRAHCIDNADEVHRIRSSHPTYETHVLRGGRLLGELYPLRAFGDVRFKWPLDLQKVVLEPLGNPAPPNLLSPPYLTVSPEVFYHKLTANDKFLVLATDENKKTRRARRGPRWEYVSEIVTKEDKDVLKPRELQSDDVFYGQTAAEVAATSGELKKLFDPTHKNTATELDKDVLKPRELQSDDVFYGQTAAEVAATSGELKKLFDPTHKNTATELDTCRGSPSPTPPPEPPKKGRQRKSRTPSKRTNKRKAVKEEEGESLAESVVVTSASLVESQTDSTSPSDKPPIVLKLTLKSNFYLVQECSIETDKPAGRMKRSSSEKEKPPKERRKREKKSSLQPVITPSSPQTELEKPITPSKDVKMDVPQAIPVETIQTKSKAKGPPCHDADQSCGSISTACPCYTKEDDELLIYCRDLYR